MQDSGQFAGEPALSNIPVHFPSEIITHATILCNIKNQGRGQKQIFWSQTVSVLMVVLPPTVQPYGKMPGCSVWVPL